MSFSRIQMMKDNSKKPRNSQTRQRGGWINFIFDFGNVPWWHSFWACWASSIHFRSSPHLSRASRKSTSHFFQVKIYFYKFVSSLILARLIIGFRRDTTFHGKFPNFPGKVPDFPGFSNSYLNFLEFLFFFDFRYSITCPGFLGLSRLFDLYLS